MPAHNRVLITPERQLKAEQEIIEKERVVDYDTKEYPVETIVQKYLRGINTDENELYVPDYQRDFAWDNKRQSKFIESVLIGLPIPNIFVADVAEGDGRLEIVDGSQRVRTLAAFFNDELTLTGLEKLLNLNDFRYSDLPLSRQRRFSRRTLRMIELTMKADEEVRRDIFERINTGSEELTDMEKRRGINSGPLLPMIEWCANVTLFKQLAPLSEAAERRRERDEFVLRFFSYLDDYKGFDRSVRGFLDKWINKTKRIYSPEYGEALQSEFVRMLEFVEKYFPTGFAKGSRHTRTPRIRFEAIAVGSALALRDNPELVPPSTDWAYEREFIEITTSDASNSRPKVIRRIETVYNHLIGPK
jgi:hypothetical protein